MPTAVSLSIFRHLFASVAEEMGVTLGRAAYSPNIKERLDFSCALFLGDGRMLAQAAHIPVHLGAMPASVDFFVASRAHHADVGGMAPGSMPLSTEIYQEGIIIPPIKLVEAGQRNEAVWQLILRNVRTPDERNDDLAAQLAAHAIGEQRLQEIITRYGLDESLAHGHALIDYANRLTQTAIHKIPNGRFTFHDVLDDDGQPGSPPIPIRVTITVKDNELEVDFAGTATAVFGNLNAVPAIAQSAVAYCVRCAALALMETDIPMSGEPGQSGKNQLIRGQDISELPGKFSQQLKSNDLLRIETPGGGSWGNKE